MGEANVWALDRQSHPPEAAPLRWAARPQASQVEGEEDQKPHPRSNDHKIFIFHSLSSLLLLFFSSIESKGFKSQKQK